MRIITANLGLIEDREKLLNIGKKLSEKNPDVIIFQEVVLFDTRNSSLDIINDVLKLPHIKVHISHNHAKDYGKGKNQENDLFEGLGILSKHSFITKANNLPITKTLDRWPRLQVHYQFEDFSLLNIHLSKHKLSRDAEVIELNYAEIIGGDFNMFPEEFTEHFSENTSYEFKKYISYPSKKQTLDYFVIRKGEILNVKTMSSESDHHFLIIDIELN